MMLSFQGLVHDDKIQLFGNYELKVKSTERVTLVEYSVESGVLVHTYIGCVVGFAAKKVSKV
jgi:hypothetical protein